MRQYSYQLKVRCASPIFKPIAYKLRFTNRKRKYFEEKTTATSKSKQTSIATVRNHLRTLASFPTPLIFHWSLPLKKSQTSRNNVFLHFLFVDEGSGSGACYRAGYVQINYGSGCRSKRPKNIRYGFCGSGSGSGTLVFTIFCF